MTPGRNSLFHMWLCILGIHCHPGCISELRAPLGKKIRVLWPRRDLLGAAGLNPLQAAVPTSAAAMWSRWGTHCEAWKDVLLLEEFLTRKVLGSLIWIPAVIDH